MSSIYIFTYIMAFLFGFGQMLTLNISSYVTVADFVVWLPMPYYLFSCRRVLLSKSGLIVAGLIAIYLLSVLLSCYLAGTSYDQALRGISRVGFTAGYMVFFVWLFINNPKSLWAMLLGAAIGTPIIIIRPGAMLERYMAEEGYGRWSAIYMPIIKNILLLVSCMVYTKSRMTAALIFLTTFILLTPFVPRSNIIVGIIVACIIMYMAIFSVRRHRLRKEERRNRFIGSVALGFAILVVLYIGYIFAAPAGLMGEYQREKYYTQASTKWGVMPWGLLLSGRTDFVAALIAVSDHPIIGMGSWNSAEWMKYKRDAWFIAGASVSDAQLGAFNARELSHHSTLMGEWAEGGIGVVFFWGFTLICSFKLASSLISNDNILLPFFLLSLAYFYWNLLFSPLNFDLRMQTGLILSVYLVQLSPQGPKYPVIIEWIPKQYRRLMTMRRAGMRPTP